MSRPKIRIESDGNITRFYINDQEMSDAVMLDFHAEPNWATCEYWTHQRDENNRYIVLNNEVISKKHTVDFESKEQQ